MPGSTTPIIKLVVFTHVHLPSRGNRGVAARICDALYMCCHRQSSTLTLTGMCPVETVSKEGCRNRSLPRSNISLALYFEPSPGLPLFTGDRGVRLFAHASTCWIKSGRWITVVVKPGICYLCSDKRYCLLAYKTSSCRQSSTTFLDASISPLTHWVTRI